MATSGFQVSGVDISAGWPDRSYLMDRYPEFADTFKQAGLWLWGGGSYYLLGLGDGGADRSSPVQTLAGGTNWKIISHGVKHITAIKTDGTLWVWGNNNYGQLGTNDIANRSTPVQIASAGTGWVLVSNGNGHTAAIKNDGTLWMWGQNTWGQLAINNNAARSTPVQTISATADWKSVSAGGYTTAAIKTNGTLWLWGINYYGNLGDGTQNLSGSKSSPVQTIAGGSNWKIVSAGGYHTGAIKTDGTLWLWGKNDTGQLGNGTTSNTNSPVQTIAAGTNWKQLSCTREMTAAIKNDGTLWTWGRNNYGQLGDNTTTNKSSPIQTIATGTNWKQLGGCYLGSFSAIKTDGTLWMWGRNHAGQLGDNTITHKSSPVQTIAGGSNWKFVSTGNYSTSAIRDDSSDPI